MFSFLYIQKECIIFIKKKTSKLRISNNDLFMNQKGHILQKEGSIAPNDPPTVRAWKLKFLSLNNTILVQFILLSSTCSVQLTGHIFIFFILGFSSSIFHKLRITLNCCLKLNDNNNWSFVVAYSPSIK